MAKTQFITGLDIGTSTIKVLVASKKKDAIEVVFRGEEKTSGVRRGIVIRPDEVSNILKNLFSKIREETGRRINSVYVNTNGAHLFSMLSHGVIAVSRADQKISEDDVDRVLQAAQTFQISSNKEIFDTIPIEFIVDGERGIKEPVGLKGVRLEAEVLVLGGFSPYIENLKNAVLNSGLQILDMISSPIAAANACLTEKQKELGVALIDVGMGTTGLTVFEEGNLTNLTVLPVGSSNITNDIAIGLKTDIDIAERVKIEFGSCLFKGKDKREKIDLGEGELLVFSLRSLNKIVEARISEIFQQIDKELKKVTKEKLLPGGVVLTGGGVKLDRIIELAKREFKLPVKIGKPKGITDLDDLSFSTVCGLVLGGFELEEAKTSNFGQGISSFFKKMFKIFIP